MNLDSTQNIILLRSYIVLKIKELETNKNNLNSNLPEIQQSIDTYTQLLNQINENNIQEVTSMLNNHSHTIEFSDFCKYINQTSATDLGNNCLQLIETLGERFKNSPDYSPDKIDQLKKALYKVNPDLDPENMKTKNSYELEEESEDDNNTGHIDPIIQISLEKTTEFFKQYKPQTIPPTEFKRFCENFRDISKLLFVTKFQQYFSEIGKNISDLTISHDINNQSVPIYKTDILLTDENFEQSTLTLQEPEIKSIYVATYYQNLCYSYLEADKYSKMEPGFISHDTIVNKMENFKDCYKKMYEMSKYKVNILSNNSVRFSSESEFEPTELDFELSASNPNTVREDNSNDEIELV